MKQFSFILLFFFVTIVPIKAQEKIDEIFTIVEEMPEYPGGMSEFYKFLGKNLRIPEKCLTDSSFQGCKVYVQMIITAKGEMTNLRILKGCPACPETEGEVKRVFALMKEPWKPGKQNGRPVNVYYSVPVKFALQ